MRLEANQMNIVDPKSLPFAADRTILDLINY